MLVEKRCIFCLAIIRTIDMNTYIGKQLGSYRIQRLLGHGGFADVYLGEHIYLKTQAAIKILHTQLTTEDGEHFRNEALLIAHLVHPHIIRVLDFGIEEGTPFLVIEYAPNGTLREKAPKGTRLSPLVFLPYVKQVASALQYAHDQKLIHRDVKPENMLLDGQGQVRLSDFGIALTSHSSQSIKTESTIMGTMVYMAPEQLQGKPRAASDQYSLAVVVYEWLTGEKPFKGSYAELISQHFSAPPPPINEQALSIPHAVSLVLYRALEKDPHARFARVQDFADALEQAFRMRDPIAVAPPVQNPYQPPRQPALDAQHSLNIQTHPPTFQNGAKIPMPPPVQPLVGNQPSSGPAMGKKASGCALSAVRTLLIIPLLLCALSVGGYAYLQNRNPSSQGTNLAKGFISSLSDHNYEQAYTYLSGPIASGTSHDEFLQQAQAFDGCYGQITGYKESGNATPDGKQIYTYTVSRTKIGQPYHLHVTVSKDFMGNWHITDYNSDVESGRQACQ